jgi:hypothetical protein
VLCSLKDLRLGTLVLLAISPGTNGLTLSPLEDQDSFLDLSPRSDRETGKKDQRIARTETATPAQENEGARALRPVIKVFEVL